MQVEEGLWRQILLQRLGPLLTAKGVNFQLDVITDYGSDPLQVGFRAFGTLNLLNVE